MGEGYDFGGAEEEDANYKDTRDDGGDDVWGGGGVVPLPIEEYVTRVEDYGAGMLCHKLLIKKIGDFDWCY